MISTGLQSALRPLRAALLLAPLWITSSPAGTYEDLIFTAQLGDVARLQRLQQRGADINSVDKEGNSLLMLAIREEGYALAEYLAKNKANLDLRNRLGENALMLAAFKGNQLLVQTLVEAGADVNGTGWTPLMYAAFNGQLNSIEYLVEKGAQINATASSGSSALMLAARNGHSHVVRYLIGKKADLALQNGQHQTALDLAIKQDYADVVALLQAAGAPKGSTPASPAATLASTAPADTTDGKPKTAPLPVVERDVKEAPANKQGNESSNTKTALESSAE
jgi:ankyrin repeat protein